MKPDKKTHIKELLSRGVGEIIQKKSIEEKLLSGKKLRVKFGVDPTGPKIHLGRASTMRKLKKFQDLGHKVVLIVGDFTAQIGDASDKTSERPMLTLEDVKKNMKDYLPQLGQILDIKKAEVHYNSKWLGKLNYFDICRHANNFSVAQILDRENFSKRYKEGTRIALRELLYPLMQGYDSVAIKADIEIGGTDQLFNVLAGRTLQKDYGQEPQDIITYELMDGTDGRKMSTSWGNVILVGDKPEEIYGKIMSMQDNHLIQYFELATDVGVVDIKKMKKDLQGDKINPRDLKMRLAREIITIYHSKKDATEAEKSFKKVFQDKGMPTDIKEVKVKKSKIGVLDLLVETKLCISRSEARRVVEQGGVRYDKKIIKDVKQVLEIDKKGKILQKGKRHFIKVKS